MWPIGQEPISCFLSVRQLWCTITMTLFLSAECVFGMTRQGRNPRPPRAQGGHSRPLSWSFVSWKYHLALSSYFADSLIDWQMNWGENNYPHYSSVGRSTILQWLSSVLMLWTLKLSWLWKIIWKYLVPGLFRFSSSQCRVKVMKLMLCYTFSWGPTETPSKTCGTPLGETLLYCT